MKNKPQIGNWPWYLLAIIIALIIKQFYSQADVSQLRWILKPVSWCLELLSVLEFEWNTEYGYWDKMYSVAIDKSCAGINFWMITFVSSVFAFIHQFKSKAWIFLSLFLDAFLLAIFVNALRIKLILWGLSYEETVPFFGTDHWHRIAGISTYLTFLFAYILTVNHLLIYLRKNNFDA